MDTNHTNQPSWAELLKLAEDFAQQKKAMLQNIEESLPEGWTADLDKFGLVLTDKIYQISFTPSGALHVVGVISRQQVPVPFEAMKEFLAAVAKDPSLCTVEDPRRTLVSPEVVRPTDPEKMETKEQILAKLLDACDQWAAPTGDTRGRANDHDDALRDMIWAARRAGVVVKGAGCQCRACKPR